MGILKRHNLSFPKVRPLEFENSPVICLAGKTGAGKSVVARYLSVFLWIEEGGSMLMWCHPRSHSRRL